MCIFCKIINHDIPSKVVYEDDEVLAILDISQITRGHTLVMPKEHMDDVLSCPPVLLSKLMCVAQKISKELIEKLDAKGINILTNAKEIAGQTVPHFHIHVIPRYNEHDGCKITFISSQDPQLDTTLKALKKQHK